MGNLQNRKSSSKFRRRSTKVACFRRRRGNSSSTRKVVEDPEFPPPSLVAFTFYGVNFPCHLQVPIPVQYSPFTVSFFDFRTASRYISLRQRLSLSRITSYKAKLQPMKIGRGSLLNNTMSTSPICAVFRQE